MWLNTHSVDTNGTSEYQRTNFVLSIGSVNEPQNFYFFSSKHFYDNTIYEPIFGYFDLIFIFLFQYKIILRVCTLDFQHTMQAIKLNTFLLMSRRICVWCTSALCKYFLRI